jgi:hypothetical protein
VSSRPAARRSSAAAASNLECSEAHRERKTFWPCALFMLTAGWISFGKSGSTLTLFSMIA